MVELLISPCKHIIKHLDSLDDFFYYLDRSSTVYDILFTMSMAQGHNNRAPSENQLLFCFNVISTLPPKFF